MRFLERGAWANNSVIRPASGGGFFNEEQLRRMTVDAMKAHIRRRIGGYTVAIGSVPTKNRLYRGRVCLERPGTIAEISYPKPEIVKRPGRANRVGKSMFYCSLGAFPVLSELRVKIGDLVTLSEWGLTEPLWMHSLGYHPEALAAMRAPISAQRARMVNPIPNETRRNDRLRAKMSAAFTREVIEGEEYRYSETIAISELLLDGAGQIPTAGPGAPRRERTAGVVYPSIQMRALADNVAILPEFADSSLQVRRMHYIRVEAADHRAHSYAFLLLAVSTDFRGNKIAWLEEPGPEAERLRRVSSSDGADLWE